MTRRPTYEECLARGMSAIEAAGVMRKTPSAAVKWAKARGLRWPSKPRRDAK